MATAGSGLELNKSGDSIDSALGTAIGRPSTELTIPMDRPPTRVEPPAETPPKL